MEIKNQISLEIPQSVLDEVQTKLKECKRLLAPFLQGLTPTERMEIFKNRLFFLIFFLIPFKFVAQFTVTGTVNDKSGDAIPNAQVLFITQNQSSVIKTFTDNLGFFRVTVEKNDYKIQITQFNVILYNKDLYVNENINLGKIKTDEKLNKLSEVVIKSRKNIIERKSDRLVYNLSNTVSNSGRDLFSALSLVPGVKATEDKLAIVGKSNVAVLIDDQLVNLSGNDLINFLKSISAEDISKIEVLTTPPAKYEAQGNSGLINIRYKKAKNNSWNSSIRNSFTKNTYFIYSVGGSFNYQKNKLGLNSNLNYANGSKLITDSNTMIFSDQVRSGVEPRKVTYQPLLSGRFGLDYDINQKISLGIIYLGSKNQLNIVNDKNVITVDYFSSNLQDYKVITKSNTNDNSFTNSFNIHSDIKLDTIGKKISLNADYFNYSNLIGRTFNYGNYINDVLNTSSYANAKNLGDQSITNYAFKVDVDHPIKWAKIAYGLKLSFVNSFNDLKFYDGNNVLNSLNSNTFKYKESVQSLYASVNKEFQKFDLQLGLRVENTNNEGYSVNLNETNKSSFLRIFPTVYINYKNNENNVFSLSYSRRIERPQFEYLNPFRIVQNSFSYVEGNPYLQPSYSDNIEFSWLRNQKWNNMFYYSKISNGFQQIPIIDNNTNIQQIKPLNYYDSYKIGLNESYTFKKFDWWESTNTLDINYTKTRSLLDFTTQSLEGWNGNIATTNNFRLNSKKTIYLGCNYWYNFPGVFDIYKTTASSSLDLTLTCSFLEKSLIVNFYGNDIFSGQRSTAQSTSNKTSFAFRNYYDSRNFKIAITYKFGNKKISVTQRDFGNDDEKGRLKN
ncbi:hypothetical protein FLACOL_01527 [Flavobacterium columnare]|uniref:Outer membrane beta-barrel family protein n=2 Tax=Flavobacterium TaxID=237 RepID=A0ABW8PM16_9FLAO|nr:outer membrane beta-barrel family protein [Flavobacterium columnare]SPE77532.1 hypothetical protein FLACOL_01527 [Flavobacterium columnare]